MRTAEVPGEVVLIATTEGPCPAPISRAASYRPTGGRSWDGAHLYPFSGYVEA